MKKTFLAFPLICLTWCCFGQSVYHERSSNPTACGGGYVYAVPLFPTSVQNANISAELDWNNSGLFFFLARLRYTTDGSDPTNSSPFRGMSEQCVLGANHAVYDCFVPAQANGTVVKYKIVLSLSNFDSQIFNFESPIFSYTVGALPVELVDFSAASTPAGIELRWKTAAEQSNDHFLVEHSTDGAHFAPIGRLAGSGTVQTPSVYQFLHVAPTPGEHFYRLQQVDQDGHSTYSNIIRTRFGAAGNGRCYPNPTTGRLTLAWPMADREAAATVYLRNAAGQIVLEQLIRESTPIDLSALPPGVYWLEVTDGSTRWTERVIKT